MTRTAPARRAAAPRAPRAPFATRPLPPEALREAALTDADVRFVPAPDVVAWIRHVFVESVHGSPLYNPAHEHLAMAHILVLWTALDNRKRGRRVLGTAEIPQFRGDAWQTARQEQQIREWYPEGDGVLPDFVITLSAPFAATASDAEFCALVEHELMHCGQAQDAFGSPRFSRDTGLPIWTIAPHDAEQFVDVVRRYGADAADVRPIVEAAAQAAREPVFSADALVGVCGC